MKHLLGKLSLGLATAALLLALGCAQSPTAPAPEAENPTLGILTSGG